MYIRLQDRKWSVEYIRTANATHTNGVTHQECDKVVQLYARRVPEPLYQTEWTGLRMTGGAFASNIKNAGIIGWPVAHAVRSPAPRPRGSCIPEAFQLEQLMHGQVPAQASQGCNYTPKGNLKQPNASTSPRLPSRQFLGASTSSSLR